MLQTFNVPAGGRIVNAKATFLRYESAGVDSADTAIRVRASGNDLGTYMPGDSIELPISAQLWEITPASATQTAIVRLGMGKVSATRLSGVVSITNKISAGVQVLEAAGPNGVGLQVATLLAAAANVRGLTVRNASVQATGGAGGTSDIRLIASPTTPVATITPNSYPLASAGGGAGVVARFDALHQNLTLPAGWGLFIVTAHTVAAAVAVAYSVTYEPL